MMHYYLYEITNNINNKTYIGVHSTSDMNDGYMGSGILIRRSIAKYGVANFTKKILEEFDCPADMHSREHECVNEEYVNRTDTYNLTTGGRGSFHHINNNDDSSLDQGMPAAARKEQRRLAGIKGNKGMQLTQH
jgi:hypothetical protein